MKPRMLLTLDAEGQLLSVPVRLGQAVDVVAQAGRPKTITGVGASLRRLSTYKACWCKRHLFCSAPPPLSPRLFLACW